VYVPVRKRALGDDTTSSSTTATPAATPAPTQSLHDALTSDNVCTAAMIALGYHGYKRTGSIIWGLVYALAGREFPLESVPIALAQGFGQKKPCP